MKRIVLTPYDKKRGSPINILLNDYWYRSANGFGSYEQAISQKVFKRIADNANLYFLEDSDGNKYKAKPIRLGVGFFLTIKPEK